MRINEIYDDDGEDPARTVATPLMTTDNPGPYLDVSDMVEEEFFKTLQEKMPYVEALKLFLASLPIEHIPVNKLVGAESKLNPAAIATPRDGHPLVVEHGGLYYVEDGNHRAANAMLAGKPTIAAMVKRIRK